VSSRPTGSPIAKVITQCRASIPFAREHLFQESFAQGRDLRPGVAGWVPDEGVSPASAHMPPPSGLPGTCSPRCFRLSTNGEINVKISLSS
jgi:hypothetical protein